MNSLAMYLGYCTMVVCVILGTAATCIAFDELWQRFKARRELRKWERNAINTVIEQSKAGV